MSEHLYAVIMAGGGGTRLWPLSRRSRPKQALELIDGRSLFKVAVDRITPIIPAERIYVVTIAEQASLLQELAPEIPSGNYLIEPEPRGTASVVGLAAAYLQKIDADSVMAVLTADHYMRNEEKLRDLLLAADDAARNSFLVTLGIRPDFPSTGYGYIELGDASGEYSGITAFHVLSFKEKPDSDTAARYVDEGKYLWNSGMFIWKASKILDEMSVHMPELRSRLAVIQNALGTDQAASVLLQEWGLIQPETIDYGVMEKAEDVVVLPADDLGWGDIGSWDRFSELISADENGNIIHAERHLVSDSTGLTIYQNTQSGKAKLIAVLGLQDLIIVDTDDVMMICPENRANEVKKMVELLKDQNMEHYI